MRHRIKTTLDLGDFGERLVEIDAVYSKQPSRPSAPHPLEILSLHTMLGETRIDISELAPGIQPSTLEHLTDLFIDMELPHEH